MIEKLIELLKPYMDIFPCENESGSCEFVKCEECRGRELAEKLIENGVILSPCKVGDEVYRIVKCCGEWQIISCKVKTITYRGGEWWDINDGMLGSTVFLTREEAEAELERRRKEVNTT